ncbi:MAG: ABC transporter permease [Planctomycetes bacterium]|nr:ABC transporter permease [Planctomycetota bacterium]
MLKLAWRNLIAHPIRSILTSASVCIAILLLCLLRSIVTTLDAGIEAASATRLIVMSSISLFVDMPVSYQQRIEQVDGVDVIGKWQWFGGYYQNPRNFFAQFAVDPEHLFDMYPECQLDEEAKQRFLSTRNGCIIGRKLADDPNFAWKVGDKIPLVGALFPHPDGGAWEFEVCGVYTSSAANFDERTMMFQWKFFEETLRTSGQDPGVGVFVFRCEPGANVERIMGEVTAMFENGPMSVRCAPESEFQRMFISMMGDIPMLLGWIGTAVFVALLLGCVNTMLMAGREQVRDIGIYKALGFDDVTAFRVLVTQSLLLCVIGGAAGIGLTLALKPGIAAAIAAMFPVFIVADETLIFAAVLIVLLGLAAGIVPAWRASRMKPIEALRAEH